MKSNQKRNHASIVLRHVGRRYIAAAIFVAAWLSGCGGGGNSGTAVAPTAAPATVVCNAAATAGSTPIYNGKTTVAICPNIFVDGALSAAEQAPISVTINAAAARDKTYYGSLMAAPPDVVVCKAVECATYFAGPSLRNTFLPANTFAGSFVAPRPTIVIVAVASDTENVLTHEGSHVELAARIGSGRVPAWFNEGLATMVGGAPDCTGVTARAFADLQQVDDQPVWNAQTNTTATFLPAYCQARAEVVAWSNARPAGAVISLLAAVKGGTPFYTAYGALLTQ